VPAATAYIKCASISLS